MPRTPTLEDVARAAGVSRQTVSNVLNSPDVVRDTTRTRVEQVIAELRYRPHAAARRLRTQRSSTIGIHLDPYAGGISGVILDRFVHALIERAGERGNRILVYAARGQDEEIAQLSELFEAGEIDSVVLTGTVHDDHRTAWLIANDQSFVSFGRPWGASASEQAAIRWVDVDGATGTRAATQHCVDRGAQRVAFLGWPDGSGQGGERERGWRETMREARLLAPAFTANDVVREAQAVIAQALVADESAFDAIVCASDTLAVGAHLALAALGRAATPVVGFDNTPVAEALGLSSVEQEPEQVADAVLSLLLDDASANQVSGRHLLVTPRLIVR